MDLPTMKLNYLPELKKEFSVNDGFNHLQSFQLALKTFKKYKLAANPVIFDAYVDRTFLWGPSSDIAEYDAPWVGIIHHHSRDPSIVLSTASASAPASAAGTSVEFDNKLFTKDTFKNSLKHCKGLFVFSDQMKEWLQKKPEIKDLIAVNVLRMPAVTPTQQFNLAKFQKNSSRKIIQIGVHLRNTASIYSMDKLTLVRRGILPYNERVKHELKTRAVPESAKTKVQKIKNTGNRDYDQFLTQNIVYLDMMLCTGDQVISDCIARATPLLINKSASAQEYLGSDYPFYYETLDEAIGKANNMNLITKTHKYLKTWATKCSYLNPEQFVNSIMNSEIYQKLK